MYFITFLLFPIFDLLLTLRNFVIVAGGALFSVFGQYIWYDTSHPAGNKINSLQFLFVCSLDNFCLFVVWIRKYDFIDEEEKLHLMRQKEPSQKHRSNEIHIKAIKALHLIDFELCPYTFTFMLTVYFLLILGTLQHKLELFIVFYYPIQYRQICYNFPSNSKYSVIFFFS